MSGQAYAIVISAARGSFVGRTTDLVQKAKDPGHFNTIMENIGVSLLALVMLWILAVWIGGFFRNTDIALPGAQNLLHYTLILLIIGVPVGMPVVTNTTLAVAVAYLAKQRAIVHGLQPLSRLRYARSISSAKAHLANLTVPQGVDILCLDKTGTLTSNKPSIHDPFMLEGQDPYWMMEVAALASSYNIKPPDPIDKVSCAAADEAFDEA